jgi:hypothetical protein
MKENEWNAKDADLQIKQPKQKSHAFGTTKILDLMAAASPG